ncbi:MAG: MFS transporter, partial [Hyphomicrobiales bacterium]
MRNTQRDHRRTAGSRRRPGPVRRQPAAGVGHSASCAKLMPDFARLGYREGREPSMRRAMNDRTRVLPPFAILVAISAIGPLSLNIFIPSMPGLQDEFGIPYGKAQLTLTLFLIGMAVCQLIYGPISDRVGRRPMLLGGMAVFVLASVLAALAPSIEVLIGARLLQALGGAAGIVLARAMVRDVFDRDKSASVISYITMAFVVAPMVAPVLGGFIEAIAGWRYDFWL